jgi:hypothetical protein
MDDWLAFLGDFLLPLDEHVREGFHRQRDLLVGSAIQDQFLNIN